MTGVGSLQLTSRACAQIEIYQRLVFDYSIGKPDAKRFMEYVKLPRNAGYVHPEWAKRQKELWHRMAVLDAVALLAIKVHKAARLNQIDTPVAAGVTDTLFPESIRQGKPAKSSPAGK